MKTHKMTKKTREKKMTNNEDKTNQEHDDEHSDNSSPADVDRRSSTACLIIINMGIYD